VFPTKLIWKCHVLLQLNIYVKDNIHLIFYTCGPSFRWIWDFYWWTWAYDAHVHRFEKKLGIDILVRNHKLLDFIDAKSCILSKWKCLAWPWNNNGIMKNVIIFMLFCARKKWLLWKSPHFQSWSWKFFRWQMPITLQTI